MPPKPTICRNRLARGRRACASIGGDCRRARVGLADLRLCPLVAGTAPEERGRNVSGGESQEKERYCISQLAFCSLPSSSLFLSPNRLRSLLHSARFGSLEELHWSLAGPPACLSRSPSTIGSSHSHSIFVGERIPRRARGASRNTDVLIFSRQPRRRDTVYAAGIRRQAPSLTQRADIVCEPAAAPLIPWVVASSWPCARRGLRSDCNTPPLGQTGAMVLLAPC